ncbi:MAG: acyl carrier protein, partial [Alteromonadaceae bacterium]
KKISTQANFFELGGDSLLSVRLITEIQNSFQFDVEVINIRDVFLDPTIAQLAQRVDKALLNDKLLKASIAFDDYDDVEEGEL